MFIILFLMLMQCTIYSESIEQLGESIGFCYEEKNVKLLQTMQTHKSHISFICDSTNKLFLVKQSLHSSLLKHFNVIREALSSYIANSIGVRVHRICIIPPGVEFPGKLRIEDPATLHTFVPGIQVKLRICPYHKLFIRQINKKKITGLTYSIIQNMARHNDLPLIVAIDTFIGDGDRHRGNYFYELTSDHFWVIDLGSSFDKNLCEASCINILNMINTRTCQFTDKELESINLYKKSLELLTNSFPPAILYNLFCMFARQAGIYQGSSLYTKQTEEFMEFYKKQILKNHASAKKLIKFIDTLIAEKSVLQKKLIRHKT